MASSASADETATADDSGSSEHGQAGAAVSEPHVMLLHLKDSDDNDVVRVTLSQTDATQTSASDFALAERVAREAQCCTCGKTKPSCKHADELHPLCQICGTGIEERPKTNAVDSPSTSRRLATGAAGAMLTVVRGTAAGSAEIVTGTVVGGTFGGIGGAVGGLMSSLAVNTCKLGWYAAKTTLVAGYYLCSMAYNASLASAIQTSSGGVVTTSSMQVVETKMRPGTEYVDVSTQTEMVTEVDLAEEDDTRATRCDPSPDASEDTNDAASGHGLYPRLEPAPS